MDRDTACVKICQLRWTGLAFFERASQHGPRHRMFFQRANFGGLVLRICLTDQSAWTRTPLEWYGRSALVDRYRHVLTGQSAWTRTPHVFPTGQFVRLVPHRFDGPTLVGWVTVVFL